MKTSVCLLAALVLAFCASLAQGPLTPPAAPAPTMKTLDQIEARTPISTANFYISTAGSYYLTQNLTVDNGPAITIASDDVTLDLNGFTISSTANPVVGTGVLVSGTRTNITIRNGHIRGQVTLAGGTFSGTGFNDGLSAPSGRNVIVMDVSVSGCLDDGIELGSDDNSIAQRCTVRTIGDDGIRAGSIQNCVALECGGMGITGEVVTDSVGVSIGSTGVDATTVNHCSGTSGSGTGISGINVANSRGQSQGAGSGLTSTTAQNCQGQSDSGVGLGASAAASNCSGVSASGIGLNAPTASHCVGSTTSGGAGINSVGTVSYCRGTRVGGSAINANIAIGCTSGGGTITAPGGKFLGTP